MDSESSQKYITFLKKHFLPLSLGIIGFVLLLYGLTQLLNHSDSSDEIVFEPRDSTVSQKGANTTNTSTQITIDIEGAVTRPGVYQLSADARVQDAFVVAGGLSKDAHRAYVAKNFNLAQKLRDGSKIYVPSTGEQLSSQGSVSQNVLGLDTGGEPSGLVNINTASEAQLDTLPGIGPVTAQKIIDNRPYESGEELLSKKAVSKSVFDKIKERISIY